jgi:hypothetical protein
MICNRMLVILMVLFGTVHASNKLGRGWEGTQLPQRENLRPDDNEDQVAEVARNIVLRILRYMRMDRSLRPGSGKKAKWACWNDVLPRAMWSEDGYCRLEIRVVADSKTSSAASASSIKSSKADSSSNAKDSTASCSRDTTGGSSTREPPTKKQRKRAEDIFSYMTQLLWVGNQVPAAQAQLQKLLPDNTKTCTHTASLEDILAHIQVIEGVLDRYQIDPDDYIDPKQGCHTYPDWQKRHDEGYDPDGPEYGGDRGLGQAGMFDKSCPWGTHFCHLFGAQHIHSVAT